MNISPYPTPSLTARRSVTEEESKPVPWEGSMRSSFCFWHSSDLLLPHIHHVQQPGQLSERELPPALPHPPALPGETSPEHSELERDLSVIRYSVD